MNFKTVSVILAVLLLNSKVLASPIESDKESDDELNEIETGIEIGIESSSGEEEITGFPVEEETTGVYDDEECLTQECFDVSKSIITSMDITADPCDDFYQYVCGGWMNENEIDDDEYRNNAFIKGRKRNKNIIKDILERGDLKVDESLSEEDQKYDKINNDNIMNLYNTCKNVDRIEEKGKEPLVNFIKEINLRENIESYKTVDGFTDLLVKLFGYGIGPVLNSGSFGDLQDSNITVLAVTQPSLYFAKETYVKSDVIAKYKEAAYKILKNVLGDEKDDLKTLADSVVDFEKKLADISISRSNLQSPSDYYNRYDIKQLNAEYPYINWSSFFEKMIKNENINYPVNEDTLVINLTPKFFEKLNELLAQTDIETLVNYIEFTIIRDFAEYTSKEVKKPLKKFSDYLNGETTEKPDDYRCAEFVNDNLGMAITKYYLKDYYDASSKEYSEQVIEYVKEAMVNRIPKMSWLDEQTGAYAANKIKHIPNNIGYPEYVWQPKKVYEIYEGLETVTDDYFTNILQLNSYYIHDDLKKLEKKVDKDKWSMNPHEVNAYYRPTANSINFPAGIFQPPFYSQNVPDYLTYGGIGAVVGHELLHSLDNSGKSYDEYGNLHNWWKDSTLEKFTNLSQCFIEQYDNYYIDDEDHVDGKLTLNENLADNGGVARAYEAWELSKSKNPEKAKENNKKLPGLTQYTPEQLFFISFGQIWCSKTRPGYAKQLVRTDSHSPSRERVYGVVSNSEQFAKAFNCPVNTKMNPEHKCLIW